MSGAYPPMGQFLVTLGVAAVLAAALGVAVKLGLQLDLLPLALVLLVAFLAVRWAQRST